MAKRTQKTVAVRQMVLGPSGNPVGVLSEPGPVPASVRQTTRAFQHALLDAVGAYRNQQHSNPVVEPEARDTLVRTIYDLVELERLDAARIDRELRAKALPFNDGGARVIAPSLRETAAALSIETRVNALETQMDTLVDMLALRVRQLDTEKGALAKAATPARRRAPRKKVRR